VSREQWAQREVEWREGEAVRRGEGVRRHNVSGSRGGAEAP